MSYNEKKLNTLFKLPIRNMNNISPFQPRFVTLSCGNYFFRPYLIHIVTTTPVNKLSCPKCGCFFSPSKAFL